MCIFMLLLLFLPRYWYTHLKLYSQIAASCQFSLILGNSFFDFFY